MRIALVAVVAALAGAAPAVVAPGLPDRRPSWSPDGNRIAFLRGHRWFVVSRVGGSARPLPTRWRGWPSTGFQIERDDGRAYLTHRARRVATLPRGELHASTRDGTLVAYVLDNDVLLYDVSRRESRVLIRGRELARCATCRYLVDQVHPRFAPDNSHLLIAVTECSAGLSICNNPQSSLYAADVQTAKLTRLSRSEYCPGNLARWSPDSSAVAHQSQDCYWQEPPVLHVTRLDGKAFSLGRGGWFSWARDGSAFAYLSRAKPGRPLELHVRDRDGDERVHVRATKYAWGDRGRLVVETADVLRVVSLDGRSRLLARGRGARWSPTRAEIAYWWPTCGSRQGVHVVSVDGRSHRRVAGACTR